MTEMRIITWINEPREMSPHDIYEIVQEAISEGHLTIFLSPDDIKGQPGLEFMEKGVMVFFTTTKTNWRHADVVAAMVEHVK